MDRPAKSDLAFAGVVDQARLLQARQLSVRELVEFFLGRISELNPKLNAFRIVLAERAFAAAEDAQQRLQSGDKAPLLGVPIAVKDDTDVEGVSTMCGTGIDLGPATQDCAAVRRLKQAGAIVIGKTHLPEFGAWPMTESATWGVTRNPWNPDRTPGGSSGGSAVAVAAGMIGAALGTDGGGSIRIPAACCNLFGLKAQRGRVSTKQAPERDYQWHGLSQTGPLTRSVTDSALLYDVMVGEEPGDPIPSPPPTKPFADATKAKLPKLRIAVSLKPILPFPVNDEIAEALCNMADLLRSIGHEVVESDIKYGLGGPAMFALYNERVTDEFARFERIDRLERRTQAVWRMSKLFGPRVAKRALAIRATVTARVNRIFQDFDVLMTPVLAKPPIEIGSWEGLGPTSTFVRMLSFMPFTPAQNLTGQPAAAVPAGFTADGLPLSVQLVGRTNDEPTVLSLAAQIEVEKPWADARPQLS